MKKLLTHKLSLARETLLPLQPDVLAGVVGGEAAGVSVAGTVATVTTRPPASSCLGCSTTALTLTAVAGPNPNWR